MDSNKGKPRSEKDQGNAGTGVQPGKQATGAQQEYLITDRALEQNQCTHLSERNAEWLAREEWRTLERGEAELANWIRRTLHRKKAGLYPKPEYLLTRSGPTWERDTREAIKAMADQIPMVDLEAVYLVVHWLVASAAAARERETNAQARADKLAFDLLRDALGDDWSFA